MEEEENIDEEDLDEGDPKSQQNAAPEYKRLIAIHAGKVKGGLTEWLRVDPDKVRRLSLSEQELEKAVLTHGKEIVRYCLQSFSKLCVKHILFVCIQFIPVCAIRVTQFIFPRTITQPIS